MKSRPVIVDGIKYPSVIAAARAHKFNRKGLRNALEAGRTSYVGRLVAYVPVIDSRKSEDIDEEPMLIRPKIDSFFDRPKRNGKNGALLYMTVTMGR